MAFSVTLKNLAGFAAASNLQLFLRKTSDNLLVNAGGDTGSDPNSVGSFTWTIAEDRPAEQMLARIYEGSTETAANIVIDSVLNVGFTEIGQEAAVLDSDITDQLGRIESNTGAGARTVTITVNDGTTALQNARVRVTEGVNSYTSTTNSSGVVVFNLNDATYTVAIAKSGYTYAGTTLVVDGAESPTYSMTATNVTSPTNPDLSAIEVLCLDDDFAAASGIDVDFRMSAVASGDQNRAHPGAKKTVTSNGSGIARFEGPQGATIEWKRGTGQVWTAVTLDNDSVTNVTSLIGSP